VDDRQIKEVHETQDLMLAAGHEYLVDSEADDLRGLIRITIEFFYFIDKGIEPLENYTLDTVCSGVESFQSLNSAYRAISNRPLTAVDWDRINAANLREQFLTLYRQFRSERDFEMQFRLLLDLFRLQIIYVGLKYDTPSI
jgi:hypothetical protein